MSEDHVSIAKEVQTRYPLSYKLITLTARQATLPLILQTPKLLHTNINSPLLARLLRLVLGSGLGGHIWEEIWNTGCHMRVRVTKNETGTIDTRAAHTFLVNWKSVEGAQKDALEWQLWQILSRDGKCSRGGNPVATAPPPFPKLKCVILEADISLALVSYWALAGVVKDLNAGGGQSCIGGGRVCSISVKSLLQQTALVEMREVATRGAKTSDVMKE
ncbi:hypothetical protein BDK51DRAFT_35168 [Blyttiomyces helicus]|uniref:Uncharacterized protein n=1 Tax=Blyttiomyces helicus TaxID=388810 RepID=A0A4P9WPH0_9FUNG|nr:hypothetical protein BDK51DRAFT_35168 [Blyttiomyces helicus]|eukprot:RKO94402.1 hypothetical protein BDK51DRAFT_35168 [Blyttiomyces helicus]